MDRNHERPPSVRSVLPIEILDFVFRELSQKELLPVLSVNTAFHAVAVRPFYHTIAELKPSHSIACLHTLSRNAAFPPLVRSFEIDWQESLPTGNLYRLLHKVLKSLTEITSLLLELPRYQSPSWILQDCTFALKDFATSIHCQRPLAQFLDSQPNITELTLRGFQNNNNNHFLASSWEPDDATKFSLLPASLPKLTHFRAIHAGPSIVAAVISGRPLEVVSIPLFQSLSSAALDALELSSRPIRRLSLMSFDPDAPDFLLPQVAKRLPDLEALHVVLLLTEYTTVCFIGTRREPTVS